MYPFQRTLSSSFHASDPVLSHLGINHIGVLTLARKEFSVKPFAVAKQKLLKYISFSIIIV